MIDKNWLRSHAEEEIEDAKMYFNMAMQEDNPEHSTWFICMGRNELEHAGNLYGMMSDSE